MNADRNAALGLQYKIRQDAMAQRDTFASFSDWTKEMTQKDRAARAGAAAAPPPIRGGARVGVRNSTHKVDDGAAAHAAAAAGGVLDSRPAPRAAPAPKGTTKAKTAARHTYDVGYKKWEQFDADVSDDEVAAVADRDIPTSAKEKPAPPPVPLQEIPARPLEAPRDPEESQRALGNEKFAAGDYEGAIRSYSLCLGLKARNYVAFSNRAMAYLKQGAHHNAEADCDSALLIKPDHAKSLRRRAAARHALGKHRAALQDVAAALALEPGSKALLAQERSVAAALAAAAANAPFAAVAVGDA